MANIRRRFTAIATGAVLALALAFTVPSAANAADETLEASFSLTPRSGEFLNNGYKPANWRVENNVTATGPQILPSKNIDLQFPAGELTFNPGNVPVCSDDKVGPPPTDLSQPVPNIVNRCPDSVLGNGTAKFALAQSNTPAALLDGVIVVFNGGTQGGRPLIKVYAYSYDTMVAVFTEAALQADGSLDFEVPQLSFDSSVTSLNLSIPSTNITLTDWGPGNETVVLPKGVKSDYAQAKCSTGSWPWSADFTFGTRASDNTPTSPDTFSSDGGIENCTGVTGKAKIKSVKVKGPSKVKRNKKATYKVKIKNSGAVTATSVKLNLSGKGVSAKKKVGKIGAGKTKTVKVKVKFKKKGKVKAKFKVTSKNGGKKTATKTIKVK